VKLVATRGIAAGEEVFVSYLETRCLPIHQKNSSSIFCVNLWSSCMRIHVLIWRDMVILPPVCLLPASLPPCLPPCLCLSACLCLPVFLPACLPACLSSMSVARLPHTRTRSLHTRVNETHTHTLFARTRIPNAAMEQEVGEWECSSGGPF
jgi:hypothetical protein